MPTLNSAHKAFLVTELAMFGMPTEIAKRFEERFKIAIDRDQVHTYNAGHARMRGRMSEELVKLFDEVRAQWKAEVTNIPLADKGKRMAELSEMYLDAKGKNNRRMMMQILEQIARESGDAYSNRRELTGKDGAPLPAPIAASVVLDLSGLSEAELDTLESLHGRHPSQPGQHPAREG